MKLLIFLGIVGLIHCLPLSFDINAGLTRKPFPITRTFLGAAKKTVDAISSPIENAQFSLSGKIGTDGQAKSVSHQIERSYSSSNLDSGLTTSSQNSASFSLSNSASLGSNIDLSNRQTQRSLNSGLLGHQSRRGSLSLSRSGSSNIDSSSHQIEGNLGSFSSNIGEQASLGANLASQTGDASLSFSRSASLGSNIASSNHQIQSGLGSFSSNIGGQASLDSSLASHQIDDASFSLSKTASLGSNIDASSHQIVGGIQEHFESDLAKTNSHHQASNFDSASFSSNLGQNFESSVKNIESSLNNRHQFEKNVQSYSSLNQNNLKSASSLNVASSAQHQIGSSVAQEDVSSISVGSVENYPIGYSKSSNFASDSLIENEARSYDEAANLEELLRRQNENAHYKFSTDIKDHISDLTQEREEVRDGLNVRGHYSYSDGNIKYIVHYVADENGYRIEKQETVKLGGPKVNPLGTAEIDSKSNDVEIRYGVRSIPIHNGTLII